MQGKKRYTELKTWGTNGYKEYVQYQVSGCYNDMNCKGDYTKGESTDRLAELENKIEDGLFVELPCKPGTTIYHILDGKVKQDIVFGYEFSIDTKLLVYFNDYTKISKKLCYRPFELVENFNKTWFIDKIAAQDELSRKPKKI